MGTLTWKIQLGFEVFFSQIFGSWTKVRPKKKATPHNKMTCRKMPWENAARLGVVDFFEDAFFFVDEPLFPPSGREG